MTTVKPESSTKQRVALVIQYLGTHFHGWQRQPNFVSIQGEIEQAIADVVGYPITLHGAGRTDAGVHAAAQVAHFDDPVGQIPAARGSKVLNGLLPADVFILGSAPVPSSWHARFSALWRRYRYSIYTGQWPNVFVNGLSWHYYQSPLRAADIQAAMEPLLGKHHLAAFHRAGSSRAHSWVDVQGVDCYRRGQMLYVEIQANGFLYGMVRLLVGLLVEVGSGQRSLQDFTDLWVNQRRDLVKYAAPPQGLCLLRVGYDHFPFPPSLWFDTHPLFNLST
jgi:tRNA pseudouridine38-40 synthase